MTNMLHALSMLLLAGIVSGCDPADFVDEDSDTDEESGGLSSSSSSSSSSGGSSSGSSTTSGSGSIYIRFTQDQCPNERRIKRIRDSNPAVGANGTVNQLYGPSDPGTYSVEFTIGENTGLADGPLDYSYTLQRPAAGKRRDYTFKVLVGSNLGRCVFDPKGLSFVDRSAK